MKEIDELRSAIIRSETIQGKLNILDSLAERLRWRRYPEEKPEEGQDIEARGAVVRGYISTYNACAYNGFPAFHWRPVLPGPGPEEPEEPKVKKCWRCGEVPEINQELGGQYRYLWRCSCSVSDYFTSRLEAINDANKRS